MLEYSIQIMEVDNLHFVNSRKKGMTTSAISMLGYVVNDKRGLKEVMEILEALGLPLDQLWKYDPHILLGKEKGLKLPNP